MGCFCVLDCALLSMLFVAVVVALLLLFVGVVCVCCSLGLLVACWCVCIVGVVCCVVLIVVLCCVCAVVVEGCLCLWRRVISLFVAWLLLLAFTVSFLWYVSVVVLCRRCCLLLL